MAIYDDNREQINPFPETIVKQLDNDDLCREWHSADAQCAPLQAYHHFRVVLLY